MFRSLIIICCVLLIPLNHVQAAIKTGFVPKSGKMLPDRLKTLHKATGSVSTENAGQPANKIRAKVVKQAAFSWGVQEGLYWRYQNIVSILDAQSLELHTVFGFNKFIVNGKMLLPTVIEAKRIYEQTTDISARTVNVSYSMDKPARIIPQPPTWRDYLIRAIDTPQKPHGVVFPRTAEEGAAWREGINRGWEEGVNQANDIFFIDLIKLKKDIEGLYRFRKLLAMGIVTMPKVASSKYSVIELDSGKTLNINDVVYSITTQPDFTETDKWEPFFRSSKGRK